MEEVGLTFLNMPPDVHYCTSFRDGDWITWRCPLCEGYERRFNLRTGKMFVNRGGSTAQHLGFNSKDENMEALSRVQNLN